MKTFKISTFITCPASISALAVACGSCSSSPRSLEPNTPSINLLALQTFKRHLSFLSTTLYCNCLFFIVLFTFVFFNYSYFL